MTCLRRAGGRDVRHGATEHAADHRVGGTASGHHQQRNGGHAVQQVSLVSAGDPIDNGIIIMPRPWGGISQI